MARDDAALRKRQQIAQANRTMFIWVAAASLIVGVSAVGAYFLFQKGMFGSRVISEKSNTVRTLDNNNAIVEELRAQIRVLNTNQALRDSMSGSSQNPVEVVLDALPSEANSTALGASLQNQLLIGDGIVLESLLVDPVEGLESATDEEVSISSDPDTEFSSSNQIFFSFQVSTGANNADGLKELLERIERSIRTIQLTSVDVEVQGGRLQLSASGHAYYEPARTTNLTEVRVE